MSPAGFRCRRPRGRPGYSDGGPNAPGAVAERVASRLAGERTIREMAGALAAANGAEIRDVMVRQQRRHAELAREYAAKVAHIQGTTQRDALEAERVLRAAEETER